MLPRLRGIALTALMCSFIALVPVLFAQQAANPSAVKRMHDHLTTLETVHYAVVRGDLEDAKVASQTLTDQLSMDGLSPDGQKHLSDLKAASIAGTRSATLQDAGAQTGKMTAACGTCHTALGKPVKATAPPKPGGEPSLKTRMLEHDYAVKLMSLGLSGPSDELWKSGAATMKSAKLWTVTLKDAELSKQVNEAETAFRKLGDKADAARDPAAKAAVYGEIVASCGHCHSLGGRVFGPGVPKQ